jgi:hypothetical protein
VKWALLILALAGCGADLDEPWQLAHDRIIAVRATPPRILPGEQSAIDLLVGFTDGPAVERGPDAISVVSPMSLADIVEPGTWKITAPSEERLAAVRQELKLMPGAPVPVQLGIAAAWPYPVMSPDPHGFAATKTIFLGESATNPELSGMLINNNDAPAGTDLVVPKEDKVPLFVEADDTIDIVNWLTSCGEMHDFDLHHAYLKVLVDQPQEGQLAVVKRDNRGGVTWRMWPISAQ